VQIDEQGLRGIDGTLPVKFLHCVSIWDYGTYKWNLHMMHEPAQKRQKTETAHNLHMMHDDELDQIPIADDAELVADQIDIADDAELVAAIKEWITAMGGKVSGAMVGQRFGQAYNTWIRADGGRNDGSFKKWLSCVPGTAVQSGSGGSR